MAAPSIKIMIDFVIIPLIRYYPFLVVLQTCTMKTRMISTYFLHFCSAALLFPATLYHFARAVANASSSSRHS